MKSKLALAAMAALCTGAALAGPHLMERADADEDGFVTRSEFQAAHQARVDEHFARVDADGDGMLSREEIESARAAHHEKRLEHKHRRMQRRGAHALERLDTDGSGSVSLAEFEGRRFQPAEEEFYAADADGNGELDEAELRELFAAHHAAKRKDRGSRYD